MASLGHDSLVVDHIAAALEFDLKLLDDVNIESLGYPTRILPHKNIDICPYPCIIKVYIPSEEVK